MKVREYKNALEVVPVLAVIYSNCHKTPGDIVVDYLSPHSLERFPPAVDPIGKTMDGFDGYETLASQIHRCAKTGESEDVLFKDEPSSGWFVGSLHRINRQHVLMTYKDVKDIVLDNLALSRAAKLANEKNEKFVRALAHDLKEPTRAIVGFTEILLTHWDNIQPLQREEYLQRANVGALKLHEMIQELRNYALSDRPASDVEPITAQRMIQEAVEMAKSKLQEHGSTINVRWSIDEEVIVISSLKRALFNFIDNAIKYRREDVPSEIQVTAFLDDKDLVVSVQDNGLGFEPEDAGRIFEPFHRLSPHEATPGVGMGLAICKDIIAKVGGRIWGTSEGLGKGSHFTFRVPIR